MGNIEESMYSNITTYRFISLESSLLDNLCQQLKQAAFSKSIKGTILLSPEGINLFLAGEQKNIDSFQSFLQTFSCFKDMKYKFSYSSFIPFKKLSVKIRKEIVTFSQVGISPEKLTAPYISPAQLKNWLEQNKDITLLDTRNFFEYQIGGFNNALHLEINNFREFPEAFNRFAINKSKPIVTYCTGGIRCEKAATYLLETGFKEVYQLQGGILNYFEACGGQFYRGDCFVFDDRISLNSKLEPSSY